MRVAGLAALCVGLALSGCSRAPEDPWIPTVPQTLLWDMFSSHIVVEVDHVAGREIPEQSLQGAIAELRSLTGRDVVLGTVRAIPGVEADASRERAKKDAVEIAEDARDIPPATAPGRDGPATLHVISLDGRVGEQDHPLGFNHAHVAFVFLDQLAQLQPAGRDHPNFALDVQQTLTHEMGHAVGLVDCHVPMVRPHSDEDCHSTSRESVMFVPHGGWDSTIEIVQPGTQRLRFDADDRADIAAYIEQGRRCALDPVGCAEPWRGSRPT